MDMNNKIYVSEIEYGRLCRVDGKMDALIEYLKQSESNGYANIMPIKAIIGMDNFEESSDV